AMGEVKHGQEQEVESEM
ncbi:hypothetical protein A2U01_0057926, partial [Trifolium medium]|nr:hypothetical protein [Trifolium medium]